MNLFSISQLSQYSGIKPHTIRIWEQRYNGLTPARSEGNTRYYDGDQLRRLLNIVSLMGPDHKVSELCAMPDNQLAERVMERKESIENETQEYFVFQLIAAGMSYDQELFEVLFEQSLSKYGMTETYKMVLYPMLLRIGIMWSANSIPSVQEHFISNIVRQKILRAIDDLPFLQLSAEKWLLFLREDEFHEVGLLFANFLIQQSGRKVLYLGSSVSSEAVFSAINDTKPNFLLLFFTHYDHPKHVQEYLVVLTKRFGGKKIYVAGNYKLLSQLEYKKNIEWLQDINDLEELLCIQFKN